MPAKKKTKKKPRNSKTLAAAAKPMKKTVQKKAAVKSKAPKKLAKKEKAQHKKPTDYAVASSQTRQREAFSGRQSGDLQGLSRTEQADSESVDELVEEGNPFEADVVAGVENADNADEREVQTHEVPEDDIPDEYLDKD
jgi:hypothetical protein